MCGFLCERKVLNHLNIQINQISPWSWNISSFISVIFKNQSRVVFAALVTNRSKNWAMTSRKCLFFSPCLSAMFFSIGSFLRLVLFKQWPWKIHLFSRSLAILGKRDAFSKQWVRVGLESKLFPVSIMNQFRLLRLANEVKGWGESHYDHIDWEWEKTGFSKENWSYHKWGRGLLMLNRQVSTTVGKFYI